MWGGSVRPQDAPKFICPYPLCFTESLLQSSEYDFVGCFDLTIGLWVLDGSEVVLDLVAGEETSKFLIDELVSVVCYHRIEYSKSNEDVPP